jgi:hypothetical protein
MKIVLSLLILILLAVSCDKEPAIEYGSIEILLTGSSAPYDEVIVEIKAIKISHLSYDNNKTKIDVNAYESAKYDLLEFSNGQSISLTSLKIAPGKLSEIIIEFG